MNSRMLIALVSSNISSTAACATNKRNCIKVCNTNNIPRGLNMKVVKVGHNIKKIRKNQYRKGDTSRAVKLLERGEVM